MAKDAQDAKAQGARRQLRAADGYAFDVYEALPTSAPCGAVVVVQEIFGVNAHIREVADGFAADGYAALAPALFDRAERGVELGYDAAGMKRGRALAFDGIKQEAALADLQATVEEAGKYGAVGMVGYCFGGLMAYLAACRVDGLACAAAYYGGGIAGVVGDGSVPENVPRCPTIMHFGALDAHIPMSDVEKVKAALPAVPVHVYDADHGFNCDHRASYHAESARLARERTLALLAEHVGRQSGQAG